jgi:hypothetical protein
MEWNRGGRGGFVILSMENGGIVEVIKEPKFLNVHMVFFSFSKRCCIISSGGSVVCKNPYQIYT